MIKVDVQKFFYRIDREMPTRDLLAVANLRVLIRRLYCNVSTVPSVTAD